MVPLGFCSRLAVHQIHLFHVENISVFSKCVMTLEPELAWQQEEGEVGGDLYCRL
jgi:hypothetical protein